MSDSHEVLTGVNEQRVTKYCAKGHFAAGSLFQQASSWLLRCPAVSRRHLEPVCFRAPTAVTRRKNKLVPTFTPHSIPFTSGPGLRRWWKKGTTSATMPKGPRSETNLSKKSKASIPIPQGTTPRSSTNARGDTNTKFRPNIMTLLKNTENVIIPELDTNFVNNLLKRIALTTSHYLCLHRIDTKNRLLTMLTNPCLSHHRKM